MSEDTNAAPKGAPAETVNPGEEPAAPAAAEVTPVATLTTEELQALDALRDKEEAINSTLRVAMTHHSDQKRGVRNEQAHWWKAAGAAHGFDPDTEDFVLQRDESGGKIIRAADLNKEG